MHFRTFQGSLVREGEVGGWIESNKNLSQSKFSWVFDEGKVYGDSQVLDDAVVMDTAEVYQNAKIYNKAIVRGDADISGNVRIYNFAKVLIKKETYCY